RAIALAEIIALTIERRRVVDLEEELEQIAIRRLLRVEGDFDRFGMCAVISVCRVLDVATRVTHPGRDDAGLLAKEILHPPETASGENRLLCSRAHGSTV